MECFRRDPWGARLLVVDNSEADARVSLRIPTAQSDAIHYLAPSHNLGYFGGARWALSSDAARSFGADWTVVSNVDLTFDPTELRAVLSEFDARKIGVIAPAITSKDALERLNPFLEQRPRRARMRVYKYVFASYWCFALYSWGAEILRRRAWSSAATSEMNRERDIYAPHGSFMIFSAEFFCRGGSLDHPPFLFGEEFTVAERAREVSLPVVYCPAIRITHEQHASVARLPSRLHQRFMHAAATYVADAFFP